MRQKIELTTKQRIMIVAGVFTMFFLSFVINPVNASGTTLIIQDEIDCVNCTFEGDTTNVYYQANTDGIYLYNDTDTHYFNSTLAEINFNQTSLANAINATDNINSLFSENDLTTDIDTNESIRMNTLTDSTCTSDNKISAISSDGSVTCSADANTEYSAGDSLSLDGTTFNVDDDFVLNTGDTMTGNLTLDDSNLLLSRSDDTNKGVIKVGGERFIHNYPGDNTNDVAYGLLNFFAGQNAGNFLMENGANGNVGIGGQSLQSLTSGWGNVGVGFNTLTSVTTGQKNTAVGVKSGESVDEGSNNMFIGFSAGSAVEGGDDNMAMGANAMGNCGASAKENVAVGAMSGYVIEGEGNTVIGYRAGTSISSGDSNVLIGERSAGVYTGSSNIYIGANPSTVWSNENNRMNIGDLLFCDDLSATPPKLYFSSSLDTNIYRSAANTLRTDDTFQAGGYKSSDGAAGISDSSSYWFCTSSDCSSTCQVEIKDGLITGCS